MTDTPLPAGVLDEKIIGMTNAAGEPVDSEQDAATIAVQQTLDTGEVRTTTVVTESRPVARA